MDAASGRTATVGQLRRHLPSAPPPFLEGALENPVLADPELLLLLRNRQAGAGLLKRIGSNRRWAAVYEVRKMLALHPQTPPALARSLIPRLFWKDLADVSDSLRLHPASRRRAEEVLEGRIKDLALGEQIALARRATRGLIPHLLEAEEPRVMRSLLANERLLETEATRVAASTRAPGGLLTFLSTHPRWGSSREVHLALLHNPRTPVPAALGTLRRLNRNDLLALVADDELPTIVKVGAERELKPDGTSPRLDDEMDTDRG